jgi:hypothetical protein
MSRQIAGSWPSSQATRRSPSSRSRMGDSRARAISVAALRSSLRGRTRCRVAALIEAAPEYWRGLQGTGWPPKTRAWTPGAGGKPLRSGLGEPGASKTRPTNCSPASVYAARRSSWVRASVTFTQPMMVVVPIAIYRIALTAIRQRGFGVSGEVWGEWRGARPPGVRPGG